MMIDWGQVIQGVFFLILVGGGFIYMRSQVSRQQNTELEKLVAIRGDRIDDLDEQVERMELKISALEGKVAAMESLQTERIIIGVIEGLAGSVVSQ